MFTTTTPRAGERSTSCRAGGAALPTLARLKLRKGREGFRDRHRPKQQSVSEEIFDVRLDDNRPAPLGWYEVLGQSLQEIKLPESPPQAETGAEDSMESFTHLGASPISPTPSERDTGASRESRRSLNWKPSNRRSSGASVTVKMEASSVFGFGLGRPRKLPRPLRSLRRASIGRAAHVLMRGVTC